MLGAVGEDVVNDRPDERQKEDQHTPQELVARWAVRFDDFDYNMYQRTLLNRVEGGENVMHVLHTRISRIII